MNNWHKGIRKWHFGNRYYISVPFSWLVNDAMKEEQKILEKNKRNKVQIGGPGLMVPNVCEDWPDVVGLHNQFATFSSRGCDNDCGFCGVPKLEPGGIREIPMDKFRPAPLICDNSFLQTSWKHQCDVIERVKRFKLIDFNQGLEAKHFTTKVADLLSNTNCIVRFAFDGWYAEQEVCDAFKLAKERTTSQLGCYCLIGYNDTPKEAREKLELVRSWGVRPTPMRYQPIDTTVKNNYINTDKGWTERELFKMVKYYSRLAYYEQIPYEDFNPYVEDPHKYQMNMFAGV